MVSFTCTRCAETITYEPGAWGVGQATDKDDNPFCYPCAATLEGEAMLKDGRATLYLSRIVEPSDFQKKHGIITKLDWRVSNWSGHLQTTMVHIRKGRHNIARTRYDVWFTYCGQEWYGVQYGENTQLLHCRRLKVTA